MKKLVLTALACAALGLGLTACDETPAPVLPPLDQAVFDACVERIVYTDALVLQIENGFDEKAGCDREARR